MAHGNSEIKRGMMVLSRMLSWNLHLLVSFLFMKGEMQRPDFSVVTSPLNAPGRAMAIPH